MLTGFPSKVCAAATAERLAEIGGSNRPRFVMFDREGNELGSETPFDFQKVGLVAAVAEITTDHGLITMAVVIAAPGVFGSEKVTDAQRAELSRRHRFLHNLLAQEEDFVEQGTCRGSALAALNRAATAKYPMIPGPFWADEMQVDVVLRYPSTFQSVEIF